MIIQLLRADNTANGRVGSHAKYGAAIGLAARRSGTSFESGVVDRVVWGRHGLLFLEE
jgi:hypothetical protein